MKSHQQWMCSQGAHHSLCATEVVCSPMAIKWRAELCSSGASSTGNVPTLKMIWVIMHWSANIFNMPTKIVKIQSNHQIECLCAFNCCLAIGLSLCIRISTHSECMCSTTACAKHGITSHEAHVEALKCIGHCFKHCIDNGLVIKCNKSLNLSTLHCQHNEIFAMMWTFIIVLLFAHKMAMSQLLQMLWHCGIQMQTKLPFLPWKQSVHLC